MTDQQFKEAKSVFLNRVGSFAKVHRIPGDLIINWDQTGINVVPSANYTMEQRGADRVEIAGYGDKRMITATFACTLSGHFLPIQILYGGKTERCHPKHQFPAEFDIFHNSSHWANEETAIRFIKQIIVPYVTKTRELLDAPNQTVMVLFDVFKGQTTPAVYEALEENKIVYVTVPGGCTDKLQPLDLSVNRSAKCYLRDKFSAWYADEVKKQLDDGQQASEVKVDMRLSVMKEISAKWLEGMTDKLENSPQLIVNGFKEAWIVDAIETATVPNDENEDPFQNINSDTD